MEKFFISDSWAYVFWGGVVFIFLSVAISWLLAKWDGEENDLEPRRAHWMGVNENSSAEADVPRLSTSKASRPRFDPEERDVRRLANAFAQVSQNLGEAFSAYGNPNPGLSVFLEIVSLVKAVVAATDLLEKNTHLNLLLIPLYGALLNVVINDSVRIDATSIFTKVEANAELNVLQVCFSLDRLYGTEHSRMLGQGLLDLLTLIKRYESTGSGSKDQIVFALSHKIRALMIPENTVATEPRGWNLEFCALLSVQPGCSLEDLAEGWRKAVKMWHPDRLNGMAPELKEFATTKLAAINAAYDELRGNFSGDGLQS